MRVRYGNGAAECAGSCVKNTALNSFVLKCCGYKFAGSNVKNKAFNLFAKKSAAGSSVKIGAFDSFVTNCCGYNVRV